MLELAPQANADDVFCHAELSLFAESLLPASDVKQG